MPQPTPREPGVSMVSYTTRNLRADLLQRMRVLAATKRTTIEDVLNRALERGLDTMENER